MLQISLVHDVLCSCGSSMVLFLCAIGRFCYKAPQTPVKCSFLHSVSNLPNLHVFLALGSKACRVLLVAVLPPKKPIVASPCVRFHEFGFLCGFPLLFSLALLLLPASLMLSYSSAGAQRVNSLAV